MALGSNIKYQLQAVFETAFDKKSASQVEQMYNEMAKRVADSSRQEFVSAFQQFGAILNNALQKLNIQPIDINKMIELPNAQMFSQLGSEFGAKFTEGFKGSISGGGDISASIQKQIQELEAEKSKLLSLQKSLPQSLKRYEYLSGLGYAEKGDVRALSSDEIKKMSKGKGADSLAQSFTDDYYGALDALEQLDVGTEQYYQTLLKVHEAASNVFRMQATMDKNPGLIKDKDILRDYGYETLQATVQDELLAREKDFSHFMNQENDLLKQIPTRLTEVEQKLSAIRQNNPEIVNKEEAGSGLKTLNEIEAAYQRILNAHSKVGKQGKNIQNVLNFDPTTSKQGLQSLYDAYTKMPPDSPWEMEYQALLKYVKLYESYLVSENNTHRKKTENPQFKALYEQLKPMATNAENMLQNVLNMANNQQLIGVGGAEAEDNVTIATQLTAETQKQAEAEAKARAESEAKARAEKEAAEAAEKERLSQEATAKAAQQSAAASEKERISKESESSYTTGSILDNPMFASMFGKATDEAEEKHLANEGSAEAAKKELDVVQKTTSELEKQQKLLLYRRVEGQLDPNRISNRSIDALYDKKNNPIIQQALESGFGGFGDGLYGSVFNAAKDLIPPIAEGATSFFEFDASGYNLYINKTVEQAEALRTFLLSLQKFVGAGTLLDTSQLTDIADLSNDQLFEEAQKIFKNFSMTKQQFDAWLEDARKESEIIAKMFKQGQVPANKHNFGTRFMQSLGYEGVLNATGDSEYDGNYHGSVIYDPDIDQTKQSLRIFGDEKEFASYLQAEAQAHRDNTVAIREESSAQDGLNKAKVQEAQIEQSDNDGAEIAEENAKTEVIKQQNAALQENISLKGQSNTQGVGAVTGIEPIKTIPDGATTGEVGKLEAVRSKVAEVTAAVNTKNKAFYDEGQIVGQVVGKENAALISLKNNIEAVTRAISTKNKAFYDEGQIVGQTVGREINALMQLQNSVSGVSTSLGGTLSNLQMPNLGNTTSQGNVANEILALENLRVKISEVTQAVRTKTTAFVQEEMTVRQSVGKEISTLLQLEQHLTRISTNLGTLIRNIQTGLGNIGSLNGINLNVNATVDLATIETTLANILTAIPNAGTNAQNNNAGGGQGGGQGGGRGGNLAGRITVQDSILDNFEAKLMDIGQLTPGVQNQINQLRTALHNVADTPGLTAWMNQFKTMRTEMNTAGIISDLDTLGQMATRLGQLRAKSAQAATSEEKASWDALIQQMETAIQHMQQGAGVDQDWLDNRDLEAYTRSMEKYNDQIIKMRAKENQKNQQKIWNEAIKSDLQKAGVSKSENVANRAYDTLISAGQIQGITPEQQANIDVYRGKIETLRNTIANFPKGLATETQKNQLISQRLEVDAYTKEIQELIANYERLSGENATVLGKSSLGLGASADAYKQELTQTIMAQTQGRASIKSYDAATNTLTYTLRTGKGEFTQYAASVRQADGALVSVQGTTTRAMGVFESIGKKIKEFSYYFTGSMMIYRVIAWVREGVTAVKEIDGALTELKKVTDETEESYDRFLDTAAKTAEKVGSTIKDVVSSTADWARLNI